MTDTVPGVQGIHHVTAMASLPQPNFDFYVGVLGMRLVKRSVNQDDPGTYHLFYADAAGSPGSDMTFFPWAHLARGREGPGQASEIPLAVPRGTLEYWRERLQRVEAGALRIEERFGEQTLSFDDPDGLRLSLVQIDGDRDFQAWEASPVPEEAQVRGIHSVSLQVPDLAPTRDVLTGVLGFESAGEDQGWQRFVAVGGPSGRSGTRDATSGLIVDVMALPGADMGALGRGRVHHVAWRVPDDDAQAELRARVAEAGLRPTPVIDRFWFRSVYFREPGGVLFEIATDGPGFGVDEPMERLGEQLVLPPWLESRRQEIEAGLPVLDGGSSEG